MTDADQVDEATPDARRLPPPRRGSSGGHPSADPPRAVRVRGHSGRVRRARRPYFRLEIHGREHVPSHGPFVLAPVHRSNLDFILVSAVTRPRMRYMGKASIWKWKWGGRFLRCSAGSRCTAVQPTGRRSAACLEVIENGEPLVMFPEGTRRSGPVVEDLFDGPAYVAARTGAPIVPVGIGGSDQAMPVGSRLIRPHKVVLVVGEPIAPPPGDGSGRVRRRVVRELTEQLRVSVQALYDEARRLAG